MGIIKQDVINKIRSSTCAVGYFTPDNYSLLAAGFTEEDIDISEQFAASSFRVVGTGFKIRDTTVITNRHVVEFLLRLKDEQGMDDNLLRLNFFIPFEGSQWRSVYAPISATQSVVAPHADLAFIEMPDQPDWMGISSALDIVSNFTVAIGQPVAAYGFPYGDNLLEREGEKYRFGPVLQQGYISAYAPFDESEVVKEMLLDLRAAPGMSGSPVFTPEDGEIIGIITEIWESTTTVAIPLDHKSLQELLRTYLLE